MNHKVNAITHYYAHLVALHYTIKSNRHYKNIKDNELV